MIVFRYQSSCYCNNYNHKMWTEKSPNQRASRVAIAGSIYMRRASLQAFKPKQLTNQNLENSIRNPSYGKIVKNGQSSTKRIFQTNKVNEISSYTRKVTSPSPLLQKNNVISNIGEYTRKTPTPSFGQFEQYENTKIKAIQDKYRTMLSDYQTKKKNINSQLANLKSSMHLDNNRIKDTGIMKNRLDIELSYSKPKQTRKMGNQINQPVAEMKGNRANDKVQQYEIKSKQLIIQKMSSGANKPVGTKRKQKVTELYPKFFKAIKNQLLLQEELRGIKTAISTEKRPQVQKILLEAQQGRYMKILELDGEEFDPFQNKKSSELSAEAQCTKLIQKFKECQQNWNQKVCSLNKREARQIFDCLNFEKAQEVSLKSFVREMSFLMEKHLRNRDLLRIYNRLAPMTQHNFCEMTSKNNDQ